MNPAKPSISEFQRIEKENLDFYISITCPL